MLKLITCAALICVLPSCWLLPAARTIADIATDHCELWASQQAELRMSPQDFCEVADNVLPFLEAAKMAQRAAGTQAKAGLRAEK